MGGDAAIAAAVGLVASSVDDTRLSTLAALAASSADMGLSRALVAARCASSSVRPLFARSTSAAVGQQGASQRSGAG